jgi:hypothetical protein
LPHGVAGQQKRQLLSTGLRPRIPCFESFFSQHKHRVLQKGLKAPSLGFAALSQPRRQLVVMNAPCAPPSGNFAAALGEKNQNCDRTGSLRGLTVEGLGWPEVSKGSLNQGDQRCDRTEKSSASLATISGGILPAKDGWRIRRATHFFRRISKYIFTFHWCMLLLNFRI